MNTVIWQNPLVTWYRANILGFIKLNSYTKYHIYYVAYQLPHTYSESLKEPSLGPATDGVVLIELWSQHRISQGLHEETEDTETG